MVDAACATEVAESPQYDGIVRVSARALYARQFNLNTFAAAVRHRRLCYFGPMSYYTYTTYDISANKMHATTGGTDAWVCSGK